MEHTSVSLTPALLTAGVTSLHFPRPVHTTHYQKGLLGSTCHMGRCGTGSLKVILDWDRPPASQGVNSPPQPSPPVTSYFRQHQKRLHHRTAANVSRELARTFGNHYMLVLFMFYKPVCQVISAWQCGYLRLGLRRGSPCRSELGNLIQRCQRWGPCGNHHHISCDGSITKGTFW